MVHKVAFDLDQPSVFLSCGEVPSPSPIFHLPSSISLECTDSDRMELWGKLTWECRTLAARNVVILLSEFMRIIGTRSWCGRNVRSCHYSLDDLAGWVASTQWLCTLLTRIILQLPQRYAWTMSKTIKYFNTHFLQLILHNGYDRIFTFGFTIAENWYLTFFFPLQVISCMDCVHSCWYITCFSVNRKRGRCTSLPEICSLWAS